MAGRLGGPRRSRLRQGGDGEHERRRRVVVEAEAAHLGDRLGGERLGARLVAIVQGEQRELGAAQRLDVGRRGAASPGPLLEQRPRGLPIARELAGGALDQAAQRSPGAVARQHLEDPGDVVGHPHDPIPCRARCAKHAGRDRESVGVRPRGVLQALGRGRGPVFDPRAVAGAQARGCGRQAKGGRLRDLAVGELAQPPPQGRVAPAARVVGRVRPDQVARALAVARRDRVFDRAVDVIVLGVPAARALVQRGLQMTSAAVELGLQHLLEQGVVPVLLVAPVERHQQHVRTRQALERLGRALALEDRVAQGPEEPVEQRGPGEEVELAGRQSLEERVAHVVGHEPVVAVELLERAVEVVLGAERQRRQVEPRGPALGALDEPLDRRPVEVQPCLLEQVGRLGGGHHQLARRDLPQAMLRAQAPERHLRLLPRGDRQGRARVEAAGELGQRGERLGVVQGVEVVEHDHERALALAQRVADPGHDDLPEVRAGREQRREDRVVERLDLVDCGGDRTEQEDRVVIALVQGDPGEGALVGVLPLGEEGRLAVPGGRRDEDHRLLEPLQARCHHAFARHELPIGEVRPPAVVSQTLARRQTGGFGSRSHHA